MKRFFLYMIAALCLISCNDKTNVWMNSISDLDVRVTTLEELCVQMNTNISSMESIIKVLQDRDYVTNVAEIKEGSDVIGYTISFAKNPTITIYKGNDGKDGKDGVDGKDGADGKDGISPIVGFKQDNDGKYYWTLNGNWMLDNDGNKVPTTGQNGVNGITPQLKVEEGYWYISYDEGSTWTLVSKAVGENGKEGKDGKDGKDGANGTNGTNGTNGITPNLKIENGYLYVSYDNGSSWSQLGLVKGADGTNGTNGTNGKDGVTPIFKIENGNWYVSYNDGTSWTYMGQATGADGQNGTNGTNGKDGVSPLLKIENDYLYASYDNGSTWTQLGYVKGSAGSDGKDGKDGKDGQDGTNGTDGVSPMLKIESDYWYISYDNGSTWSQLGKATGADGQNGTNGTNGTNGKDGVTPLFKIEGGQWYVSYDNGTSWSLSGQATGADGQNGTNGTNGKDGITPMFKIESDYWYVSYDKGSTWSQLSKATGADGKDGKDGKDGNDGKDGKDGDSMFKSVTQDDNYAYFTLADGTIIKIAKYNQDFNQTIIDNLVTSITTNKAFSYVLKDEKDTIIAITTPFANSKVTWTSADPTIATIANGIIVGVKYGHTTVTAQSADKSITIPVYVVDDARKRCFNASNNKKVYFSPGLEYYYNSQYRFETSQLTYYTTALYPNTKANSYTTYGRFCLPRYTTVVSNGGEIANWRLPEDLAYIIKYNDSHFATVGSEGGIVILPIHWPSNLTIDFSKSITLSDWTNIYQKNGAVFLPSLGYIIKGTNSSTWRYQYTLTFTNESGSIVTKENEAHWYWGGDVDAHDTDAAYVRLVQDVP